MFGTLKGAASKCSDGFRRAVSGADQTALTCHCYRVPFQRMLGLNRRKLCGSKPGRRCADTYNRTGIGHIVPRRLSRITVLMPGCVAGMADRSDNVIGRQSGWASTLPMLRRARQPSPYEIPDRHGRRAGTATEMVATEEHPVWDEAYWPLGSPRVEDPRSLLRSTRERRNC